MTDKLLNLSPSSIEQVERCGMQYYFYKSVGPVKPNRNLIMGSALHEAAEYNHRQKISSFRDVKKSLLQNIAAEAFDNKVENEGVRFTKQEKYSEKRLLGLAKDIAVGTNRRRGFVGIYSEDLADKIQPVEVEKWFELFFPSVNVKVRGILDVFTRDRWLIDLKTGVKVKPATMAHNSAGLSFYALWEHKNGHPPTKISLENIYQSPDIDKVQSLTTSRTERDFQQFINRMNKVAKVIRSETFLPAALGSWICTPAWCGYHQPSHKLPKGCPYGQRQI